MHRKQIPNTFLATIPLTVFRIEMHKQFKNKPLNEPMIMALYNRFRPLKINHKGDSAELQTEMDVLDFLLGINCLSRCSIE